MTVKDAIRQMAAAGLELYCKICTVDAVDTEARTVDCTPIDEGAPLLGVNLQADQQSGHGVVAFPAVGSYVVVSFLSESAAVVVLAETVEKIVLKIGATTAEVTDGKIEINGGGLGGLVVSGKTTDKLNALESEINELKTAIAAWVPVAQDGGAVLKTALTAWAGQPLTPTVAADLENSKITH